MARGIHLPQATIMARLSDRLGGFLLTMVTVTCSAASIFALVWGFVGKSSGNPCINPQKLAASTRREVGLLSLTFLLIAPLAIWLTAVATSGHLRQVAWYAHLNWMSGLGNFLSYLSYCNTSFHRTLDHRSVEEWVTAVNIAITLWAIKVGVDLAVSRVEAVEVHSLRDFGGRCLHRMMQCENLVLACICVLFPLSFRYKMQWASVAFLGLSALNSFFVWPTIVILLCRALFRIRGLAKKAAASAPSSVASVAKQVPGALRTEMICLMASFLSSFLSIAVGFLNVDSRTSAFRVLQHVLYPVDQLCNALFALLLSGALSGAVQGTSRRAILTMQRQQRRMRAMARWLSRSERQQEEVAGWDEKVVELAGRGISLAALLQFYRELPSRMGHFDPNRHTTGDVVFQAIIPMTSAEQCAGSHVLMKGAHTRPEKMVTHAWGNLFLDLLAGVVADAFEEGEFTLFSKLLVEDMPELERWVQEADVGGRTYWICAFSVNQHRAICLTNGEKQDPVTGRPCPACSCGLPKAWNDTRPVLPDGRSVLCEMNKFDDMIRFLASTNSLFAQVVPIDTRFQTFTRAWCIAEIATANDLGMVQDLKICSTHDLKRAEPALRGLKIQDMQASRPEDKAAILAGIEDHTKFDEFMQRLIFEDLLPTWSSMDARERMSCAGRFIRWHDTTAWAEKTWEEVLSEANVSRSVWEQSGGPS